MVQEIVEFFGGGHAEREHRRAIGNTFGGFTDMAVYRPTTAQYLIRRSSDLGTTTILYGDPASLDAPRTTR